MSRSAVAILSSENLLHNLRVIKEKANTAKVIAMVKANAYGHGIRSASLRLDKHVDMLGVACIDEALALRKVGINSPIVLMEGVFEPNELLIAAAENFHVVFNNQLQIEWLDRALLPYPLKSWLKINTGMGRLGFSVDQATRVYQLLAAHKKIAEPVRIMSHLSCAENFDHPLNKKQIQAFKEIKENIPNGEFSLCNSAGIWNFPECAYDYVRPGLALYGVSPFPGTVAQDYDLKPVMTLQTGIVAVQNLKKGDNVGYGGQYTCPEDMPVGIIAFGYGDGYPITARNGTPIIVNDVECPLIGRVSMDMISIDLRPCPNAKIGDPVILWGNSLPIEKLTEYTSSITWSILTGVQHRVKFFWSKH
jgi:alanine racemase